MNKISYMKLLKKKSLDYTMRYCQSFSLNLQRKSDEEVRFTTQSLIGWHEGGAGQASASPETDNTVLQVSKYWDSIVHTYFIYKNMIC